MSREAGHCRPFFNLRMGLIALGMGMHVWCSGAVRSFDASEVRLLPGSPFQDRQELHRGHYLAALDINRLLFHYRDLAGLAQPEGVEQGYPGWDQSFLRGHMAGHYLSAASRMAVATGDDSYRDKVNAMVQILGQCQQALNEDGYLAAFPSGAFDLLEGKSGDGGGVVVPYYIVHKIMAGLLDAHEYLGNEEAIGIVNRMAMHFVRRLEDLDDEQLESMLRTDHSRNPQNEFGAMSDILARLYAATGEERYLATASLFNRAWLVEPLANGENPLPGLHGNTHIAQVLGFASVAKWTKDVDLFSAAEHFWNIVTQDHSFAIGGNSFNEWFAQPGVESGPSIDSGKALPATTAESCNTHNMLKLTRSLFEQHPSAKYADYYERALYNHLLATVSPDSGAMSYFTPLRGHFRTYLDGTHCCVGSGIENPPRYNEGIYFTEANRLWVNLYIPSELNWTDRGTVLRMQGDVLRGEAMKLTVLEPGRDAFELLLRIPHWIAEPAVVELNGTEVLRESAASSYVSLHRVWKSGDVITLRLRGALRLEPSMDDERMVSIFHGPVLLAGALGDDAMPHDVADKDAYLEAPATQVPVILSDSREPADWLRPVDDNPLVFVARNVGPADGIVFRPLYDLHHQRYAVYWQVENL